MDRRSVLVGLGTVGISAELACKLQPSGAVAAQNSARGAKAPPATLQQMPAPIGRVAIKSAPLGAGGFVTGLDISSDGGRFACRTDVCNAYVRDRSDPYWRPLFSPTSMGPSDLNPLPNRNKKADGQGVSGVRIAPSDKDVIYATYLGYAWRSTDGGRTVRRTKLAQQTMMSNAGRQRLFNPTIDVHPLKAGEVVVGTWGDGAWHSSDGGENWNKIALPMAAQSFDAKPGVYLVLFDALQPQNIYIFVTGVGLFHSTVGAGGEFMACPGGPAFCSNLVGGRDGSVLLCEHTEKADSGLLWNFHSERGWSSSKPPYEMRVVAVDPNDPRHLVASNENGFIVRSTDRGIAWKKASGAWSSVDGEVGWIGDLVTLFPSQIMFDPARRFQFWMSHGVGVCRGGPVSDSYNYIDWSAGIEELCAVSAISVPGGRTYFSAWDKPFWRLDDENAYNNNFRYPRDPSTRHSNDVVLVGTFLDYAGDDPNFLVGVTGSHGEGPSRRGPGYSSDGGENWYLFEGKPPKGWGFGGCIAASTKTNFVLLPSNNAVGCYTQDGGKSWDSLMLDGLHDTSGFANAYYVVRKNISADKTRPGVFSLVYTVMQRGSDPYGNPLGGMWLTQDGGRTWKQTLRGLINHYDHSHSTAGVEQENRQFWQCQLDYVPGLSGELLYTAHADFKDDRLWWSNDDGVTWKELNSSVRNVRSFGFGKPAPGSPRPALYFSGTVGGATGVYASFDWLASKPHLLSRNASPLLAEIIWVAGDPNRFGRIYLGASAGGWLIADFGPGLV